MTIDDIRTGPTRPGPVAPARESTAPPGGQRQARRLTDRVELSAEALAAAREMEGGLPAERVAELRASIDKGVYDSPEVLRTVARRILEQGALGTGSEENR